MNETSTKVQIETSFLTSADGLNPLYMFNISPDPIGIHPFFVLFWIRLLSSPNIQFFFTQDLDGEAVKKYVSSCQDESIQAVRAARPQLELSKLVFQSNAEGSAAVCRHRGEKKDTTKR